MPVVSLTLSGIDQSVERPALIDIIHQVEDIAKIDRNTRIMFPGDININQTAKSSIDEENDRRAIFTSDRYLHIEVESEYEEGVLGATAIHQKEHIPVFHDPEVDVALWPIYLPTEYTIQFRYQTISKTEAMRWRDDMRARISQMRDTNLHSITYHFLLPDELLELLLAVYDCKVRLASDKYTALQYIDQHSTNRLLITSDLTNKNRAFAISETQTRILGQFDFSPLPEKIEREDGSGAWICSFAYKFKFDRPALMGCRYPVLVYNQILPAKYVTFLNQNQNDDQSKMLSRPKSLEALSMFEVTNQLEHNVNIYVPYRIPDFDELRSRTSIAGYGNFLSVLTQIDENDRRGLFNLTDLDPYRLDDDILEFIRESEYPFIHHAYQSVIHVGLYEGGSFKADRMIRCDNQLNLTTAIDVDLKKMYHVVFSLLVDLPYLHQSAIDRLRRYPKVFKKIIECINESLRDFPELQVLARKPHITETDFNQFFRFIVGYNTKHFHGPNNLYINPTTADNLTRLDVNRKPTGNRRMYPTRTDALHRQDYIQPYRGYIFEELRRQQIGFKRAQLTRIISIHHQH